MIGEGVKRGVIGVFKAGELKLGASISRLEVGRRKWSGAVGISGGAAELDSVGEDKKGPTCGAHMLVIGKEKNAIAECTNLKSKALFDECAKASRSGWAERGVAACEEGGPAQGGLGRTLEEDSKEKKI
jgi:hypothetical protein